MHLKNGYRQVTGTKWERSVWFVEDKAFVVSANADGPYKYLVAELSSQQQGADTKMFLCSQFALKLGFDRVTIATIDTGVAIQRETYLEDGTSTELAMFNVSGNTLEKEIVNVLPGIHAISGWDWTSCFHGKGMSPC